MGDKNFGNNIDLNKHEIRNAVVQVLATAPSTPATGQIFFDSALGYARVWDGTNWKPASIIDGLITSAMIANSTIVDADIASGAAIGVAKISGLAAIATSGSGTDISTGTVAAGRLPTLDAITAPVADVALNSHKITGLLDPTANQDAATKIYVDNAIAGLAWKDAARVASTANVSVTSAPSTIDGATLAAGDRVFLKNQTTGSENGVWIFASAGSALTRATDADSQADLLGLAIYIQEGTANAGTAWVLTTDAPLTVGSTTLTFAQFAGGTTYTATMPIQITGTVVSVVAGSGITADGTSLRVDRSTVMSRYATSVGDGAATSFTVTHNLGTLDVNVTVYAVSGGAEWIVDVVHATTNTVTVVFATAPTTNQFRVVVIG